MGSQLTASVLDVINGVYGGAPDAPDRPPGAAAATAAGALVGAGSAVSLHEHSAEASSSATAEAGDGDDAGGSSTAAPAEPELSSSSLVSTQPSEPPCAGAPLETAESAAAPGGDEAAAVVASPEEDSVALLARVGGLLDARGKVQAELGGFLQRLSRQDDGEGQLLQARLDSEAYGVLVERLLAEGRAQSYRALQGWKGPHRWGRESGGMQGAQQQPRWC